MSTEKINLLDWISTQEKLIKRKMSLHKGKNMHEWRYSGKLEMINEMKKVFVESDES